MLSQRLRYWGPIRLLTRIRQLGLKRLPEMPGRVVRRIEAYAVTPFKRRTFGQQQFTYQGTSHAYCVHNYTTTWRNERAVEIPLALAFLDRHRSDRLLEIGNVTRHFDPRTDHVVVDKYDVRTGVVSEDIDTFVADPPFDALLSISTLEHVGWDEDPRDPTKLARVLDRLVELVADPRHVFVTLPIGYNTVLDDLIRSGRMPFAVDGFLARRPDGTWHEVDAAEALVHRYGAPFDGANAIYVGEGVVADRA